MNRFGIILITIALILTAYTGGFYTGVNEGLKQSFLIGSSVKASLLTYELNSLRAGDIETNITTKEIELDGEVVRYTRSLKEGRPWVLWQAEGYELDHDKYMTEVAKYRKKHPAVIPTLIYEKENPMKDEMEKYKKEVVKSTELILKKYDN